MKSTIVRVPSIKQPIQPSPGFQKKELADYKLDILGLCEFGCRYCSSNHGNYLRINRERFVDLTEQQVGTRRYPALDPTLSFHWPAVLERLEAQLASKPHDWGHGKTLVFSMLTDGFSPSLVKSGVTRAALTLVLEKTAFRIRVLTKNAVVGSPAWIEFFQQYPDRFTVGLSTGSLDDEWSRHIEVGTSLPSARIRAVQTLQEASVPTYGMLCPVFPDVLDPRRLEELIDKLQPWNLEHLWAEPYNDRQNWRQVRDAYPDGDRRRTWMNLAFGTRDRTQWSSYATDLYTRLQCKAATEGWTAKLRYLLYETDIAAQDATQFTGLAGVLLQAKPNASGYSRNASFAEIQEGLVEAAATHDRTTTL